jgi:hypothetical protein
MEEGTMSHNRRIPRTLAGFALAALLAGCVALSDTSVASAPGATSSARESTEGTPEALGADEALRRDAEAYARQFGVTVEEATQRMQFQDGIGDLNAALQANEAGTFGGLWIEHEPDYRVVALFTRNGKRTIRPYLAGKPYAHLIEVRKARHTLAELESIQSQAMRELAKLDFRTNVLLDVQGNRVEVPVSDREWFESELQRIGAQLPDGVELRVVEGGSTARDKDLLLTPPVPGVAFPRQKPTEGFREAMAAELVGTLRLEEGCLRVYSLHDNKSLLPIWPPEFTLRVEGDQVLVIDGQGQVVARSGQEVYMGGGGGGADEWVLQQIPPTCRGEYFIVGMGVRPNLIFHSDLFALDVSSDTGRTILTLSYKPALYEQAEERELISGELVLYDYDRCPRLQTNWDPITLFWPAGWSLRAEGDTIVVVDGAGRAVARSGETVRLSGKSIPQTWESGIYRRLVNELPGDCHGTYWIVEGVE